MFQKVWIIVYESICSIAPYTYNLWFARNSKLQRLNVSFMLPVDCLFERDHFCKGVNWNLSGQKICNWFIKNSRSQKNCFDSNIILTVWINISFKRFSLQLESRDKLELTTVSLIWYFLPIFTNRYRNSSDHNLINISSGVQSYLGNIKLIDTHLIIAVCDNLSRSHFDWANCLQAIQNSHIMPNWK